MKNLFNSIKLTKPKSNVFDLSHDVKMSLNMGLLVPVMCTDTVPGDKFNISCETLLRFAPMIAPVMHRIDITVHYFFCPYRLLWPSWEEYITSGDPDSAPAPPVFGYAQGGGDYEAGGPGTLADYLGLPRASLIRSYFLNALPFSAYQKIYNDYYRDQNLIEEVNFELIDGNNINPELFILRRRAWEHDYFTSALPFAQKGAAVTIPIGQFEDVVVAAKQDDIGITQLASTGVPYPDVIAELGPPSAGSHIVADHQLYAKTSQLDVGAAQINDLRRAYRLQEWLEKNARGGSRYVENILSHFGVRSSDKRLQRPEYITGVKAPVVISEVLNTTGEVDGLPQGNMAGHGVGVVSGRYGSYFCEEHGIIMGIMSVMPKPAYMQGIPKMFLRRDNLDYYWPAFANIGEQPVINAEIYVGAGDHAYETFGYVPRYSEYKFQNNRVAGDFATSLNYWHFARIFETMPSLNKAFIECDPANRPFAVIDPDLHKLYAHVYNKVRAVRPMPKFGTPAF